MAFWREIPILAALALEAVAVAALLGTQDWLAVVAHLAAATCFAIGVRAHLGDGLLGWGLALGVSLFVPVVGGLGLVIATRVAPPPWTTPGPALVRTKIPGPEDVVIPNPVALSPMRTWPLPVRVAAARSRTDPGAIALLRRALEDQHEDVRLVAHAVLESKSRAAYRSLHQRTADLEAAPPRRRPALHRRVAAEHWEVARLGIAQGEVLLHHALEKARHHLMAALELEPLHASVHLLLGRVELGRGDGEKAEAALRRSLELGLPASIVQPYLAEAAFLLRRFDRVREGLAGIVANHTALDRIRRYWS